MTASAYTPELAAKICAALVDGKSLRTICKAKGMPAKGTVFVWLRDKPEFLAMYTAAREDQADALADEIIEIADKPYKTKAEIAQARMKIDTRKWVAGKLRPKKYGDRVVQEHTGAGGGPITSKVTIEYVGVGDANPDSPGV